MVVCNQFIKSLFTYIFFFNIISNLVCVELPTGSPVPNICKCNSGTSFGLTCTQGLEMNPCFQPNANNLKFPTRVSPSVYVQCQGTRPHFMFCQHGLVYSPSRQMCDWSQV
jgi:hypothetical protein